jgi:hypothetical protein
MTSTAEKSEMVRHHFLENGIQKCERSIAGAPVDKPAKKFARRTILLWRHAAPDR